MQTWIFVLSNAKNALLLYMNIRKKKKTCPTTQQFLDYTGKEVFLLFKNLWKVKKAHGQLL